MLVQHNKTKQEQDSNNPLAQMTFAVVLGKRQVIKKNLQAWTFFSNTFTKSDPDLLQG